MRKIRGTLKGLSLKLQSGQGGIKLGKEFFRKRAKLMHHVSSQNLRREKESLRSNC